MERKINQNSPERIKVLQITHCSHSYFLSDPHGNPDDIVKGSWGTQVGIELKKRYPSVEVECWNVEKREKEEKELMHEGIKIRIFPATISPMYALDISIPMLNGIKKEITKAEKDGKKLILHIHEYHNILGILIAAIFKDQIIIAQHHGGSRPLKHLKENRKYRWFFPFFLLGQLLENRVLRNMRIFYALSDDEMEYLRKITNSKIKFQTMGVAEEYFQKISKEKARRALGLKKEKKILLFIGRINETKGIPYLLEAMKELKDIDLKIAGYLQNVETYREYAKTNNLDNVEFLGGVFGEKKMLYLSAADALVLPSSKEGAPVVIMEAMARGLPVIVTDAGGIPLMVEDKQNGLIIRQKNPTDIINAARKIVRWPKKDFKEYADRYRWGGIIEDTMQDYLKIIEKKEN
jgi:glycosyltransferase involved in cell wall biosynthesis